MRGFGEAPTNLRDPSDENKSNEQTNKQTNKQTHLVDEVLGGEEADGGPRDGPRSAVGAGDPRGRGAGAHDEGGREVGEGDDLDVGRGLKE